ncbi:MAG: DUF952 domain-containing protein [Chloroflexi bacterium]|nr:DUF952 domain-containing protein [Chloroflexota bacterium]
MTETPRVLYLLLPADEAADVRSRASFTTPSLEAQGFIHASGSLAQAIRVANRKFAATPRLTALAVDRRRIASPVRDEWANDAKPFPHIYGPLNTDAITEVLHLKRDASGKFIAP